MPRKKKELTEKELSKIRDVEAYKHNEYERTNNPKVGYARYDRVHEETTKYAYDPHIDPTLQWAGKQEGMSFEVPTSSIHIHEVISPHKILRKVMRAITDDYTSPQISLFPSRLDEMKEKQKDLEFYKHGVDWTNRMIAGDSLVIMNSLLQKEGLAGQVQMVYFDPPYGIKYKSNFQPFINKRDVGESDNDLSQEPESITAFRDTWELGIHSYLSYLRNRLYLTQKLLAPNGSVFIQISDENVHYVRTICDEIFGHGNECATIVWKKGTPNAKVIRNSFNYILWYAKDIVKLGNKVHKLFDNRTGIEGSTEDPRKLALWGEFDNGEKRPLTTPEKRDILTTSEHAKVFRVDKIIERGSDPERRFTLKIDGEDVSPKTGYIWRGDLTQMKRLQDKDRLVRTREGAGYKFYISDYPVIELTNLWEDTAGKVSDMIYVVQTNEKIIQRCMLMSTDPGDLVMDITCGSGTTANLAEQWGRRWITCDTSRVAIDLAKQRLMTSTYDYYKLAQPEQGVDSGFVYKIVPHVTLKAIANDEPSVTETLYDQPEIEKYKIRVTGPFTVESLPATVVNSPDGNDDVAGSDMTAKQSEYRDEIQATGIIGKNGEKLEFSRIEAAQGTEYIQAIAETKEENPRRAAIHFGSETKVLDAGRVEDIFDEVQQMRPTPKLILVAAYQFDPEATKLIEETKWPDLQILAVQMNTDLMTSDLKKKRASNQSFFFIGQPDVELIHDKRTKDVYKVQVNGFDYYDPKTGKVKAGSVHNIAMWMLDEEYDGSCIQPEQVFFPLGGKKGGWHKLAKTLHAELDQDAIEQYAGNVSLPFKMKPGKKKIAVKIIDDRGIESMKVLKVGENDG